MSTAVQPFTEFQSRLFEKIRNEIGGLMTDDELKKLVEVSMQKAFFERRIKRDYYERVVEDKPPEIVEFVGELMKPMMQEACRQWMADNPEKVKEAIKDYLDGNALKAVVSMFSSMFNQPLYDFQNNLRNALASKGIVL